MAGNSPHLVPVPESWKSYFTVKPGFDYKDVLKTELHIWKINALTRGDLKSKAEKKRFLQKHWDSHYIVISATLVLFFKNCKQSITSKPQVYIKLSPCDTVTAQVKTSEKHKYCFAIKTAHKDDRDWVFSAPTAEEMQIWMAAFEATIDFMKHGRIKKWSLEILKKQLPGTTGPETKDNDICYEEIPASDGEVYDLVQPDQTYLTDVELSILAGNFGYRWKAFAREKLLLNQSEIECIEGKNKYELKEQMFDALLRWRRKQTKPNHKAKLIALLKSSQYCDPEAWHCLEKPETYGYVTLKKDSPKECSSHTYDNVTPREQTMQHVPVYSRTLYATNTPNQVTGKALNSDVQSPVKKDTRREKCNTRPGSSCGPVNKNWEMINAEMKQKMKKRSTQYE